MFYTSTLDLKINKYCEVNSTLFFLTFSLPKSFLLGFCNYCWRTPLYSRVTIQHTLTDFQSESFLKNRCLNRFTFVSNLGHTQHVYVRHLVSCTALKQSFRISDCYLQIFSNNMNNFFWHGSCFSSDRKALQINKLPVRTAERITGNKLPASQCMQYNCTEPPQCQVIKKIK